LAFGICGANQFCHLCFGIVIPKKGGFMRYAWLVVAIVFLGGCLTRTYVTQKPRVDREIEGNRGYLLGQPTQAEKEHQIKETRTISVLEIEFGSHQPTEHKVKEVAKPSIKEPVKEEEFNLSEETVGQEALQKTENTLYTIEKGDTLQKISMKFYGTTKKWKKLYEANKDVLKSPNKVYPGKIIKIPALDKKQTSD
jgi:LysM repeat protein